MVVTPLPATPCMCEDKAIVGAPGAVGALGGVGVAGGVAVRDAVPDSVLSAFMTLPVLISTLLESDQPFIDPG